MSGHVEARSGRPAVNFYADLLIGIQVAITLALIALSTGEVEELSLSQHAKLAD
jgi:hypothetical protein